MFSQVLHRFLHTCSSLKAVEKAALLELRKKTGYTFTNCKKALEATDNDVKKVSDLSAALDPCWIRNVVLTQCVRCLGKEPCG